MISLKPPVVPRPSIGGAPKADTTAPRTSPLAAVADRRGDGVGRQSRTAALGEILEHHVHRAQVGRVGAQDQRLAGDAHGVLDARRLAGDRLDLGHDALGALHRGGVGQLHVQQQVALVLLRNEARRARW